MIGYEWRATNALFSGGNPTLNNANWNELLRIIEAVGLPVTDFKPEKSAGMIHHIPSRAYFEFSLNSFYGEDSFDIKFWPSPQTTIRSDVNGVKLYQLKEFFLNWLLTVRTEASTPDLWAELANQTSLKIAKDDEWLTLTEKVQLVTKIDEIRKYLLKVSEANQENEINAKLDYLIAETNRNELSWREWKIILYGTFASLAIEHLASPQIVEHAIKIISDSIQLLMP